MALASLSSSSLYPCNKLGKQQPLPLPLSQSFQVRRRIQTYLVFLFLPSHGNLLTGKHFLNPNGGIWRQLIFLLLRGPRYDQPGKVDWLKFLFFSFCFVLFCFVFGFIIVVVVVVIVIPCMLEICMPNNYKNRAKIWLLLIKDYVQFWREKKRALNICCCFVIRNIFLFLSLTM